MDNNLAWPRVVQNSPSEVWNAINVRHENIAIFKHAIGIVIRVKDVRITHSLSIESTARYCLNSRYRKTRFITTLLNVCAIFDIRKAEGYFRCSRSSHSYHPSQINRGLLVIKTTAQQSFQLLETIGHLTIKFSEISKNFLSGRVLLAFVHRFSVFIEAEIVIV